MGGPGLRDQTVKASGCAAPDGPIPSFKQSVNVVGLFRRANTDHVEQGGIAVAVLEVRQACGGGEPDVSSVRLDHAINNAARQSVSGREICKAIAVVKRNPLNRTEP